MSTSDQVRAILGGTIQAYRNDPTYRHRPDVHNELERIGYRLNQPIRIALAGTLKAGKSTLVNALVGEDIAPTDATEATRIVTWFRHGPIPKVTANHRGGRRSNVPIARGSNGSAGLTFDFASLDPEDVVDLDVEWPAAELIDATIIDTPGTSSLSRDVSERTLRLLVPEDGVPRVDAVVFLLRTLNAADIALLKQIGELVGGSAGALGVIGVASRADEIGAGRIDAMLSAKDVAKRFTNEMDKTGICQAVVPVSGLLALTARTLRQSEFVALEKLAGVDAAELTKAMLSVDRFVREDSSLARRRRHPGRPAGPVRHVRHQDLDRGAARRCQRFGGAGRRAAGAQWAGGAARRHRPAVRATFGSAEGAHRAAVAAAVRADQPDLCDALHPRRHRSAACRYACLRRTSVAESIAFASNDIERRRDGVAAAHHRRLWAPTPPAGWGCSPTRPTTGRGRRSRRLSDGAAAPTIPSTTRSPPAPAGGGAQRRGAGR